MEAWYGKTGGMGSNTEIYELVHAAYPIGSIENFFWNGSVKKTIEEPAYISLELTDMLVFCHRK